MTRYDKLVRDKIPAIIAAEGKQVKAVTLNDSEYLDELVKKLAEECAEFTADRSLEELADVQEVVLALAEAIADPAALERVRAQKAAARGRFADKVFLEEVVDG